MKLANKSIPNVPESKFHNICYKIYQIYLELISIFILMVIQPINVLELMMFSQAFLSTGYSLVLTKELLIFPVILKEFLVLV